MIKVLCAAIAALFVHAPLQAADRHCEDLLSRKPYRQKIRQSVQFKYSQMVFTTLAQNRRWIELSTQSPSTHMYFWLENSMMKELNDSILKNKELVTALTNLYKEIFLKELKRQMPDLHFELYSDFKALGFALPLPVSKETREGLESVFNQTNLSFRGSKVATQIARPEDVKDQWFKAGIGGTDVTAAWAARYARDPQAGGRHLIGFEESQVQMALLEKLRRFHELHSELEISADALFEENELRLDVFAAARKNKSSASLSESLKLHFKGISLKPEVVRAILEYVKIADDFSPNLLIEKRETPRLASIPYGAISLDFINLGAANLKASAKALANSRGLTDAAALVRSTEREVTVRLENLKAKVRATALGFLRGKAAMTLTGDDGTIEPQIEVAPREQMRLLAELAGLEEKNFLRMASINAQPETENASEILNHGEKIEKLLRQRILTELGPDFSQLIDISVLIYGEGTERSVQLILNPRVPPSAEDIGILKQAFEKSLKLLEEELGRKGSKITYEPLDIYAMRPVLGDLRHLLSPVVVPGYGFAPDR